jgi:hypothetical protein
MMDPLDGAMGGIAIGSSRPGILSGRGRPGVNGGNVRFR